MKKINLIILVVSVFSWQILVMIFQVPQYILPTPSSILYQLYINKSLLLTQSLYTITETILGIIIALIVSLIIIFLIHYFSKLEDIIIPIVTASQTIPYIIFAPILIILFGYGMSGKIVLVALMAIFPILMSLLTSLRKVTNEEKQMFYLMGASKLDVYLDLILPKSIHELFSGLKISVTYAYTGAMFSEMMGAKNGLGIVLTRALSSYEIAFVFSIVLLIIIITLISIHILTIIERKIAKEKLGEIWKRI